MLNQIATLDRDIQRATPDIGHDLPIFARGRLTLESGVPVSISDQSAKATLYFSPIVGCYGFDEVSLALGALAANTNYDIFLEDLVTMSATAWATATTRVTALVLTQGYFSLTGDLAKRYIGTIRINATGGQSEDTISQRYVWNTYNRRLRRLVLVDATANWAYAVAVWRQMRATAANKVEFVTGLSENAVSATQIVGAQVANNAIAFVNIGLDRTNAGDGVSATLYATGVTLVRATIISRLLAYPGIGYHFLAPVELASAGAPVFFGAGLQALQGGVWA
jgi:hypothetical protein